MTKSKMFPQRHEDDLKGKRCGEERVDIEGSKATIDCHKPCIPVVTFLPPLKTLQVKRIDRPRCHGLFL